MSDTRTLAARSKGHRLSRADRKAISEWLVGNDVDLYQHRTPYKDLPGRVESATGIQASARTIRALLWRLHCHRRVTQYAGRCKVMSCLRKRARRGG